jgi:phage gpG-like protein
MKHFDKIISKLNKVERFIQNEALDIIGQEAINHFQDSFQKQGFTDGTLQKWEDVKRRDANSSWHGFKYGSTNIRPGAKRRKEGSVTNYSDAATKRPILSGETQELLNAFEYQKQGNKVTVFNTKAYAQIHNEGGTVKVFNKYSKTMPKRQFMGKSAVLKRNLEAMLTKEIIKLLK